MPDPVEIRPAAIVEAFELGLSAGKNKQKSEISILLRNLRISFEEARHHRHPPMSDAEFISFVFSDLDRRIFAAEKKGEN